MPEPEVSDDEITGIDPDRLAAVRKRFRIPNSEVERVEDKKKLADRLRVTQVTEEAYARGSIIREGEQRYARYFGDGPGREPTQDNQDMALVLATLKLCGQTVDQIDITRGHTAVLIREDGRVTLHLDVGDTPENLQPRMMAALAKIPVKYPDPEVAKGFTADLHRTVDDLHKQHEESLRQTPPPNVRIERGGLE